MYSISSMSAAASYSWVLPGGWTGSSTSTLISSTVGSVSGNLTVTAINACSNSAPQTLSVTVGLIPSTPGSISGPVSTCVGSSANSYSIAPITNATAYSWILPSGWSGSSTTNIISATPGSSGIFTVVATNSCGTSQQQTLNVTVNAQPTISANSGSICSGNSFTIVPNGASTYTIQGGSAIVSPGSTTSYTIIGTSAAGCVSASSATSNIVVNATPTITVNNGSVCSGNSFTIVPSGASTYTFSTGPLVSPMVNSSYSVTGTSTAGCVSSNTAVSNVTVNTTPTISMSSGTICPGGSFTLSASGASTYTYSSGPIVSPAVTTTYSAVGSSTAGCNSTSTTAVVTVTNNLVVSITGTNTICNGQSVNLTASGASTYTWNTSSTTSTIAPTPTANTTYSVVGASGSCSNSALFSVTVNPTPTITASTNNTLICLGQVAVLTASGATSYTWNPGAAISSSISVSPSVTTTYTITGTNSSGCSGTTTLTQNAVDCTGLNSTSQGKNNFDVYPNPTANRVTLSGVEGQSILIYNIIGDKILSTYSSTYKSEIDLSAYANGIYFVKVGTATKKIIKE
jgi:hypothetical protein